MSITDKKGRTLKVGQWVLFRAPRPAGPTRRGQIFSFDGGGGGHTARVTDGGNDGFWVIPIDELTPAPKERK